LAVFFAPTVSGARRSALGLFAQTDFRCAHRSHRRGYPDAAASQSCDLGREPRPSAFGRRGALPRTGSATTNLPENRAYKEEDRETNGQRGQGGDRRASFAGQEGQRPNGGESSGGSGGDDGRGEARALRPASVGFCGRRRGRSESVSTRVVAQSTASAEGREPFPKAGRHLYLLRSEHGLRRLAEKKCQGKRSRAPQSVCRHRPRRALVRAQ
jgi:hypothetical protein